MKTASEQSAAARTHQQRALNDAREAVARSERESQAAQKSSGIAAFFGKVASVLGTASQFLPRGMAGISTASMIGIGGVALSLFADEIGQRFGGTAQDLAKYGGITLAVVGGALTFQERIGGNGGGGSLHLAAKVGACGASGLQAYHEGEAADHTAESASSRADSILARARATTAQDAIDETLELVRVVEASSRRAFTAIMRIADENDGARGTVISHCRRM